MHVESKKDTIKSFYRQVDSHYLVANLDQCLGCGKCVGNCPVAAVSPSYNSRQIIRDVLAGQRDRLLASEEIWRCFMCGGCYVACPSDIPFPLLILQLRSRAVEAGYGLKYIRPFRRFALKAREDALTFFPSEKGRERVKKLRSSIGLSPLPEVSDKAKEEYKALFDLTGSTERLNMKESDEEKPVSLLYVEGRIISE